MDVFWNSPMSIYSNLQHCSDMSLSFVVTPTNLVLTTGKISVVLFILSEIIDFKNQEKNVRNRKFLSLLSILNFTLH